MQLLNLSVDRIIIHQIHQKDKEGNPIPPTQSHEFTELEEKALASFTKRVTDALGEGSKAVEMEIVKKDKNDLSSLIDTMIDQTDEVFAVSSFDIAKKLSDAQRTKNITGGIVAIFTGKQGFPAKKFLGVIKAEIYNGYAKIVDEQTNKISLDFIEELLLTPSSKLYKTIAFFEKADYTSPCDDLNDKWLVMISDNQISQSDGKAAAQYFYSDFAGCGYPQTSARTTKQFYEATKEFITSLNYTVEVQNDLIGALTTYLKVDKSTTIDASSFASTYFDDPTVQDSFKNFLDERGLPNTAFTKDIEHIKSKLQIRKVVFNNSVKVLASPEIFKTDVIIKPYEGDKDGSGIAQQWTQIIIKDRINPKE